MTDLSPPAQAIAKAFDDRYELLGPLEDDWQEQCLAAAFRVAAAIPSAAAPVPFTYKLLEIADELEGTNDPA
jgi:hypothetical protein